MANEVGGIDVLVNNAALVIFKPHEEFTIAEYEDQVRVNSSAAFVLSRVCSEAMKEKRQGKIINITSLTLTGRWEGYVPYIASKGAMYGLVKGLARELGEHLITVNGISPGAVLSEAEFRDRGRQARGVPPVGPGEPEPEEKDRGRRHRQPRGVPVDIASRPDHRAEHPGRRRLVSPLAQHRS